MRKINVYDCNINNYDTVTLTNELRYIRMTYYFRIIVEKQKENDNNFV